MSPVEPPRRRPSRAERERELRRLEHVSTFLADRYYLPSADREDVAQIARMAVWEALERWDGVRDPAPLAWLVARRRLATELRAANFERRRANLHTASTGRDEGGGEVALVEQVPAAIGLDQLLEARAELRAIAACLPALSSLERHALGLAARGEVYASRSSESRKRHDNAVQRARRKIRSAIAPPPAA